MRSVIFIVLIVSMFLACVVGGIGWLTTKWDLKASQVVGEQLRAENKQLVLALDKANWETEVANRQIELANTTIGNLKQKLVKSEKSLAYWWQKGQPKREFQSLEELKAWLAEDDSDSTYYYFGGTGCIGPGCVYDCDNYAVALMRNALWDGYLVSTQMEGGHMINSTVIGNEIYFIEPQTDEVWLWGYRD